MVYGQCKRSDVSTHLLWDLICCNAHVCTKFFKSSHSFKQLFILSFFLFAHQECETHFTYSGLGEKWQNGNLNSGLFPLSPTPVPFPSGMQVSASTSPLYPIQPRWPPPLHSLSNSPVLFPLPHISLPLLDIILFVAFKSVSCSMC